MSMARNRIQLTNNGNIATDETVRYVVYYGYWINSGKFFVQIWDADELLLLWDKSYRTAEMALRRVKKAGYRIKQSIEDAMVSLMNREAYSHDPLREAEIRKFNEGR